MSTSGSRHLARLCAIACLLLVAATTALGATRTWSGAANTLWSNPTNWGGTAPVAGDDLVFPAAAANLTNTNDLPDGTSFHSITIDGDNYEIGGHSIALTNGLAFNGAASALNLAITATTSQTWSTSYSCSGCTWAHIGAVQYGTNTLTLAPTGATLSFTETPVGSGPFIVNGTVSVSTGNVNLGPVTMNGSGLNLGGGSTGDILITHGDMSVRALTAGNVTATGGSFTCSTPGAVSSRNVSLSPGSIFHLSFGPGTIPMLDVTGTVSVAGATLAFNSPGGLPAGATYVLINNDGSDPIVGRFAGLPEGATFVSNGQTFTVSYVGGTGNDLTVRVAGTGTSGTTTTVISSQNPAAVGQNVTFTANVTSTGGTPTGNVEFLDGSAPLAIVALDASGNATCTKSSLTKGSHSIAVAYGGADGFAASTSSVLTQLIGALTWVPVAAHNPGLKQSQWRTDLGLLNTGSVTAFAQINFIASTGVVSDTTYVPAGTQSILTDVVGQLGGSGQGALAILSDQSLMVTSRTYNQVSSTADCYPNGTQGQDYPVLVANTGLAAGEGAYLAGLTENAAYRCNIGLVKRGSGAATVLVELFNGAGTKLTDYTVPLSQGQWAQETQPFKNKAGQTAMDRGYAKITMQSGSGVFGFASVVDNLTNDPTTVAMQRSASWLVVWVPVAASNPGLKQSHWRTDLGLLNTGSVTANAQIKFFSTGGVVSNTTYVPAGTQSILTDVVGQLGASGQGALEILSDQPLKVTSRTYNQVSSTADCYPDGTQGQDYPVLVASSGLVAGQGAYLAGLTENAGYRCNIGLVNAGSDAATVLVELYSGAGTKLTSYTVPLAAGQWAQETQPFKNKAGQTAMDRGFAKITVQSGTGVFGFASVVDNLTNDPTTVTMQQ